MRLRPEVRLTYEREANHAAIEILAQGDALRREADDSRLTITLLSELSAKYQISLQAISRYVVEQTRREAALALRFRGNTGNLGPVHVYCSPAFESRFGWSAARLLPPGARIAADEAQRTAGIKTFPATDISLALVEMSVDVVDTQYALIAIFTPTARRLSVKRLLLGASGEALASPEASASQT